MSEQTWEPGDPIYRGRGSNFGGYFYNFRDPYQSELNPDACDCGDAASWPEPKFNRRLPEDPLAKFIAEYHQQKKEESSG